MKWQIKDIITAGAIISLLAVIIVQFMSITRLGSKVRSLEIDMKLMRMYVDASEQKNNLYDEVLTKTIQNTLEVTENMAKVLEMMDEKIRYIEDLIKIID